MKISEKETSQLTGIGVIVHATFALKSIRFVIAKHLAKQCSTRSRYVTLRRCEGI